jgi:hypothetical protein
MGFEVPRRPVRLVFEDADLAGAQVLCRSVSLDEWLTYLDLGALGSLDDLRATLKRFGDEVVESWDLTIKGAAVDATGEGLLSLPVDVGKAIYNAWQEGVVRVASPLGGPSSNGALSLEPSIPMVPLSENHQSL